MAGITIAMLAKPKPGMKSSGPSDDDEDDVSPPSSKPAGASSKKLFKLFADAFRDGDDDAAFDALKGVIDACGMESE